MKSMILVGLMMALLTACTKNIEFDGFDPTTSIVKWVFTGDKKKLKRTSVHITPSAIPCTATEEAVKYRGGVEPLALCKYVHGKHEVLYDY
jgi:hypothetical protein